MQSWFARLTAVSWRGCALAVALCWCAAAGGCIDEQQTIRVAHLKLTGVKAVNKGQLKSVLATVQSSKWPWGDKHYFTRPQFDADLKRIVAFYRDRGYPDAKVASFDVKLNQKQDAVDLSVNIEEGQPILVERLDIIGLEAVPPETSADSGGSCRSSEAHRSIARWPSRRARASSTS